VVFHNSMLNGSTGYLTPLLMSALMAAYVMVGFDSAGELAEETHSPRAVTPRTIVRALIVSGIGGAFLLIAALMAAPSLTDGNLASPTGGLPYVLTSVLGTTVGKLLLVDVALAITVCTLAVQTAGARMIFSMARDVVLPFSKALRKVSPRFHTPLLATVVPGVGAALCLVVNVKNPSLFLGLTSVCIMLLYIAYLMVTAPMLLARLRGGKLADGTDEAGRPLFSLGRWGLAVNAVAVVYGLLMAINLGLPRQAVYDPTNTGWYVHYLPLLTILATFGIGGIAYAVKRGAYHSTVSVESHAMLGALDQA
jgi:urea carboxylase system permease